MLRYPKGAGPKVLIGWQATPNADWESLSGEDKDHVRAAILRDQGRLCAYCQRRIPTRDEQMKVEHWQAQSGGKDKLRWSNLLGVCLGDERAESGAPKGELHCDTSRGNAALFLHPVDGSGPSPREHLKYTSQGQVLPRDTPQQDVIGGDIKALNLNAVRLRRERRVVYEALWDRLEKAGWTPKALRDEYEATRIEPGVRAVPQCEVVRYHVVKWARKRDVEL
ncbi:MAG: retron system putative HNH endonuclease [Byssovorax sp.]